jgi:curved DNA-binding protein CbpA
MFMVEIDSDSQYSVLGVPPDALAAEIREARDRRIEEVREQQRREPANRDELIKLQKAINAAGEELARPARREQYDRQNPHLRFFTVRTAAAPMFVSAADRLAAVRAAVAAHLDAAGVPAPPGTDLDLDQWDLAAECTPHPLLDD